MSQDYLTLNRQMWNDKTGVHVASAFYDMPSFLEGRNSLNSIELELLGDIKGKSVLHLQCHFGQDTLSLARMGAEVTGIDFSDAAIGKAQQLSAELQLPARFVQSDVYSLPQALEEQFDVVFTSYGVVGWLPDMEKWAEVISNFLKPGGQFVMSEFHPVVWMMSEDFSQVKYYYFNREIIVEETVGTYADKSAPLRHTSHSWNHSLDEVIGALLRQGLRLEVFREYDYSPYDAFENTVETAPGVFHIAGMEGKLPLVYALKAVKPKA